MRRLVLFATALAASLSASLPAEAALPKTVYVRKDGKNVCSGTKNVPFNFTLQCAKSTIQAGINAVAGRGTVRVAAGTYVENVVANKSVFVVGAGKGKTFVQPALSAPNPCEDSSLCGGAASNVFLVKASDVWIEALTVDGANPAKTGVLVEGMDIDARNGIIEDHLSGVYKRLTVKDVEVKNVFLRAINAASGGTEYLFTGNTVTNVRGSAGSVGIFAFDGTGTISNNLVSLTNDAISVNHSHGFKITGNTVEQSGSGIHIDNTKAPGPGILLDLIESNTVSSCTPGGFGIWLLATEGNVVVNNNTVSQCDVGLALLGGGGTSDVTFSANVLSGSGAANTAGVYVTTDTFAWGHFDTGAKFSANVVSGFETGAFLDQGGGATSIVDISGDKYQGSLAAVENLGTVTIFDSCLTNSGKGFLNHESGIATVHDSSISGNDITGVENQSTTVLVDATDNWWGSASGPGPSDVVGAVTSTPYLTSPSVVCP